MLQSLPIFAFGKTITNCQIFVPDPKSVDLTSASVWINVVIANLLKVSQEKLMLGSIHTETKGKNW